MEEVVYDAEVRLVDMGVRREEGTKRGIGGENGGGATYVKLEVVERACFQKAPEEEPLGLDVGGKVGPPRE